MQVDFFEEFPNDDTLEKAKLLLKPSLVYLAARSVEEFDEVAARFHAANPRLELGYWPILPKSYWVSPFSYTHELRKLFDELRAREGALEVLLDLELPFLSPALFLLNFFSFKRNKKLIRKILWLARTSKLHFSVAEYSDNLGKNRILAEKLGISFSVHRYHHQRIIMFYTSVLKEMRRFPWKYDARPWGRKMLKREIEKDPTLALGIGTISIGIFGNEPILSLEELHEDLAFCASLPVERTVLFRLGGLTEDHIKVIEKFV